MKVNDLEDKIMSVWGTCEDIDTFLYRYLDSPAEELSEDDIANTLLGIKTLHDQRCQKLWDAFGEVLKSNRDYNGTAAISSPIPAEKITCNLDTTATLQADREPLEPEGSSVVEDQRRLDSMGLEGLRSG